MQCSGRKLEAFYDLFAGLLLEEVFVLGDAGDGVADAVLYEVGLSVVAQRIR